MVFDEPAPPELSNLPVQGPLLLSIHPLVRRGLELPVLLLVLRQDGLPLPLGRLSVGHLALPHFLLQLVLVVHLVFERLPLHGLLVRDLLHELLLRGNVGL